MNWQQPDPRCYRFISKALYEILELGELPARIPLELAAMLLGFTLEDGRKLAKKKQRPLPCLGQPRKGCTYWVASVVVRQLARDVDWLDEATDFCYGENREKNGTGELC